MGRVKSKLIKRTGSALLNEGVFTIDFEHNKKILKDLMPSKKIRNQVAGYISRKMKLKLNK